VNVERRERKTRRQIYSKEKSDALQQVAGDFDVSVRALAKEGEMYIGPKGRVFEVMEGRVWTEIESDENYDLTDLNRAADELLEQQD
jgi:hypothetical protein